MAGLTMRPLHCGTIYTVYRESWGGTRTGSHFPAPAIVWVIEGGEELVVVDTAFRSPEIAQKHKQWECELPEEQKIENQLSKVGIDPKEVKHVILTHMHWDHDGNLHLFPNAKKWIWRRELQYTMAPCVTQAKPFEAPIHPVGLRAAWVDHRITFTPVDETTEIIRGVIYFPMPGHSIAEGGIAVDTDNGTYVICGDLLWTYSGENRPPAWPELPTHAVVGQLYSLKDAAESLRRVKKYASSPQHILPSHDFKVLEKEIYP